jgi:glycerate kinase
VEAGTATSGEGAGVRPLRIVVAPDSFKGSLTSVEVAAAIAAGWLTARPDDVVDAVPLADGGAGTIDALLAAGGWRARTATVHDPLGREVEARWLTADDGRRAFVEMAEASGLARVPLAGRAAAAVHASTGGTGELLRAALDAGLADIVLGVGGSATSDGGAGALVALGARVETADGVPAAPGGAALADVARVDLADLDPRLAGVRLRIACDVSNPLLGPAGAAAVYGPQKGASPDDVTRLDRALAGWADALGAATGRDPREVPGTGAAGGITFGLLAIADRLASVTLVPGVELVAGEVELASRVRAADLVITGEGRIDAQTGFGKTGLGVARIARDAGVPCLALGGSVQEAGAEALAAVGALAVPVWETPVPVAEAMAAGAAPVRAAAERIARRVTARGLAAVGVAR